MRAKKREFSKIIIAIVGAATGIVMVFTLAVVWKTGDTSPLAYLIPTIFAELATATGFYYSKAKTESSSVRSTGLIYTMIQRRTENMLESVLQNLINIGWAMLIFLAAYLANVAFSLWYNIKILHESFDKDKLIASGLKILTFVVGLTLLCTAITTLPLFANQVGWAIPEEYSDLFADLIIIGAVLLVACKYIKEAFTKFVAILNAKTEGGIENE